jgi:hypothetical protein
MTNVQLATVHILAVRSFSLQMYENLIVFRTSYIYNYSLLTCARTRTTLFFYSIQEKNLKRVRKILKNYVTLHLKNI